jgi:hypothetical protein
MTHDPATGEPNPYPSHATQWRHYYGSTAWLFNPWTGDRRDAQSVGSDTFGYLIRPPGEPLVAAPETSEAPSAPARPQPAIRVEGVGNFLEIENVGPGSLVVHGDETVTLQPGDTWPL